jgi:tRNA1(Val) A37 N6-methylase TrmN6
MRCFWRQAIGVNRGRILDMGAGVGGVSLCLARRLDAVQITAIEIDPVMAALAQRNVAANGFDDRLRILRDDIVKMPPVLAGSFDHVVSNPPYHYATGTRPRDKRRALAHIGEGLALGDWVASAMWAAKPRGRISFICRADRADELIHLFTVAGCFRNSAIPALAAANGAGWAGDHSGAQGGVWPGRNFTRSYHA